MKLKGQIVGVDPHPDADRFVVHIVASGKKHSGGRDQDVVVELSLNTSRGTVRDFALGDFFEVSLERLGK